MNLPSPFRSNSQDPLRALTRIQDEFDRLFRDLTVSSTRLPTSGFNPSCELLEDKANFIMKFDMPGVSKEDLKIEVEGNQLMVSAERREEKKSDDKKNHYSEISYGSYQRSFSLPSAIDEKKVNAKFDNGVLTLTVPKVKPSNGKKIAIQ